MSSLHGRRVGVLAHHGELQPHARQRRLQIVADAGQHFGALLHVALDALAHGDEGLRRAAHFGRAIGLEVGHRAALAEGFRRERKPLDGPHLIAQEQDRDGERAAATKPPSTARRSIRARRRQPLLRNDEAQNAVFQLHFEIDVGPHEIARGKRKVGAELRREDAVHRILQMRREAVAAADARIARPGATRLRYSRLCAAMASSASRAGPGGYVI